MLCYVGSYNLPAAGNVRGWCLSFDPISLKDWHWWRKTRTKFKTYRTKFETYLHQVLLARSNSPLQGGLRCGESLLTFLG